MTSRDDSKKCNGNTGLGGVCTNRICADSVTTADIQGYFPDGSSLVSSGSTMPMSSIDLGSNTTELQVIQVNNTLQMAIMGQTLAYFPQFTNPAYDPSLGPGGGVPMVRFTADLFFAGDLATPIPEPRSALLFIVGMMASAAMLRRSGSVGEIAATSSE